MPKYGGQFSTLISSGLVVTITAVVVITTVFSVLISNIQSDLNAANTRSDNQIQVLQQTVLDLAEATSVNITYDVLSSIGHCEILKGCNDDTYSGTYRILIAHTGSLSVLAVEIGPFTTFYAKKKKKNIIGLRAHGVSRIINCFNEGDPVLLEDILGYFETFYPKVMFLSASQLANFNLTGPNLGNGVGKTFYVDNYGRQSYLIGIVGNTGDTQLTFYWEPDFDACAGDEFDLIAPTIFPIGVLSFTAPTPLQKR